MNKVNQSQIAVAAGFTYVLATVFLTVYGQIVLKWRISKASVFPDLLSERIFFFLGMIRDPWVLSSIVAGFFAFLCWMAALTKFDLSYAYPFMSLSFLLVLILSVAFFHEPLTIPKVLGVGFVVAGIIIGSHG